VQQENQEREILSKRRREEWIKRGELMSPIWLNSNKRIGKTINHTT